VTLAILDADTIFDTAGTLIVVFDRQGKIQRFNRTCEVMTGYSEAEAQGHWAWEFLLLPAERLAMKGLFQQLINGQTNIYSCNTWLDKSGNSHVIAWSNTVINSAEGQVDLVIASGIEVTDPRKHQRQLEGQYRQSHLLAEITREIHQSLALSEILNTLVKTVQELLGCDRVIILHHDSPNPVHSHRPKLIEHPSQTRPAQGPTLAAEAVTEASYSLLRPVNGAEHLLSEQPLPENPLTNTPLYLNHYRQQSLSITHTNEGMGASPEILAILETISVKSELVVPILATRAIDRATDDFWGLLIAHQCTQTHPWSPIEIDLMQQLAGQIGIAINHAELLDHLEELVHERTNELTARNQQLRREMNEHQKTELALRRSEQQLRLVTDALPALVAYIDIYHRYRFNNYAYESWYNIPYQQIKGRQVCDIVSLEVYRQMLPYLEQALAGEKVTFEAEMIQSSGDKLWASVSYIPDIQDGRVKGLFSLINDISDRKATERLKDEFVSVVSHELRTPLTSVHGSLKLLATGQLGSIDSQGKELIDIALNNTERLTRLINDMLDLEKIGSGKVSMSPQISLARDLVQNAVKAMQSMADKYSITLVAEAEPAEEPIEEPIEVWADTDHIMQALTNLISNAIKFSPTGARVLVKARASATLAKGSRLAAEPLDQNLLPKKSVEFSVKDAGRGIPSDKLEAIFERFQQVDSSDARERGGTGLGLAICREIVQQHQGRIWVKSIHGQGSTFYFTLPSPAQATAQLRGQSPEQSIVITQETP
jgi:two-component system, OmpR family, sensor histidine kinase VicK